MTGLLETILTRRYGAPVVSANGGREVRTWNAKAPDDASVLYWGMKWDQTSLREFGSYRRLYGDAFGGLLLGDSLKVATLARVQAWGTYELGELQSHSNVQRALAIDRDLLFFMDAANVWYYAIKGDRIVVFDSETGELDELGPIEAGIDNLLREWESAREPRLPEKA